MGRGRNRAYAAGLAVVASLAGCAGQGSAQQDAVARVATAYDRARAGDPSAACALLAPRTFEEASADRPCVETVGTDAPAPADGPPVVEVYGKDAIARFAGDTLFLALFDTGWRVTAAGCRPRAEDLPYDCAVEGS